MLRIRLIKGGIKRFGSIALMLLVLTGFIIVSSRPAGLQASIEPVGTEDSSSSVLPTYNQSVSPQFLIDTDNLVIGNVSEPVGGLFNGDDGQLEARLFSGDGEESSVKPIISGGTEQSDQFIVRVPNGHEFTPGKFRLEILMSNGGRQQQLQQDFMWGVLAVNLNSSVYRVGERAQIGVAVLDDDGTTLCDAQVSLNVLSPSGQVSQFTTDNNTLVVAANCMDKTVSYIPDYLASYEPIELGQHTVEVTAHTVNGTRKAATSFDVVDSADFVFHRSEMAMRIYPPEYYYAKTLIEVEHDFQGIVRERVPASFELSGMKLMRIRAGIEEPEEISTVEVIDDQVTKSKLLEWKDVRLWPGDRVLMTYTYKIPEVSPEFYLVGPITLTQNTTSLDGGQVIEPTVIASEPRQWQIAADSLTDASATRLWSAGFELNSTTANMEYTTNVGTTPSISSSTFRSGAYALQTNLGGAGTSGITYQFATADSATRTVFRAYLRISTLPNTTTTIMTLRDLAGTEQAGLRMTSTGALQLFNEEQNTQIGSDTAALNTDTWYRLELQGDFGTAVGGDTRISARINGEEIGLFAFDDWVNGIANVAIGILTTATANFFWDDLAVNQDAFTNQENWPGEGKIVHLHPDGNGTDTSWTGDYTAVDEVTPNDVTDFINCTATSNVEDYTYQDSSAAGIASTDSIRLVESWVRTGASATGARDHTTRIVGTGGNDTGGDTSVNSTTWFTNDDTVPRNAEVVAYDDPGATNYGPISPADLDGFETELVPGAASADCTPNTRISTMWLLVEYVPSEGGRLFSSGFELQPNPITEEWEVSPGTVDISTSTVRSGAASLQVTSLASGTVEAVAHSMAAADSSGPFYLRTYLYISTAPSAENRFIGFADIGDVARAWLTLDNSRILRLYDEDGQIGSASSALSASTWYRIEMKFDSSGAGSTDIIEARIDGTNFAASSTRNLSTGAYSFYLGGNLNAEAQTTGNWFFDDAAVNGGWGVTQNSYPGEGKIVHLRPNGNGDATAWTNSSTNVDEINPDDGTTVISSTTLNQVEEEAMDNSSTPGIGSGDTITLVSAGVRMNTNAAATMALKLRLRDVSAGPFIESSNVVSTGTTWFTNAPAFPAFYPITAYTRPLREDAFSPSGLDNIQVGVRETVDTTSTLQVTTLWALVEYVPVTSITVSGNAYEDEATTALTACDGSATMIAVRIGSTTYGPVNCADANGSFSVPSISPPTTGTPIHLWIEGATCGGDATSGSCAGTVILYSGTGNITDAIIRRNRLLLRHDDAGPVTNANIGGWDNDDDADVVHTVAGSNLTTENFIKIIVNGSDTFTPGGNVTTSPSNNNTNADGDVLISSGATLSIGTNALSVGGDFTNSGTFTKSTGQTTTFTAISGSHAIEDGTSNFDSVTFNGSGGGWSFSSAVVIDVDLTVTAGTLSGTNNVTVSGGDASGDGTISLTGGTFTLDGTGNFGGATGWTFSSLTFGDGSGSTTSTASGSGDVTVTSVMTIAANQTLSAGSKTYILTGNGTPFVVNGTFTASTSTVRYTNTTSATAAATTYNHLNFEPASGTPTYSFVGGAWYNVSWSNRKTVTLESDQVAGSSDLTNFSVLISLASDSDLAADAQDDGDDIVFTSADGATQLDHEIESFNGTTGALVAWVEVPTLDYNDDTIIYLYYGNGSASNQQNINGTWNSNYKGVWHLDESPSNGVAGHDDSTASGSDGTPQNFSGGAGSTTNATGKISGADYFDNTDDYVSFADGSHFTLDPTQDYTWEFWLNKDTFSDWDAVMTMTIDGTNYLEIYATTNTGDFTWGPVTAGLTIGWNQGSNFTIRNSTDNVLTTGSWYHVAFVYDASAALASRFTTYVNGVDVTDTSDNATSGSLSTLNPTNIRLSDTEPFAGEHTDGLIDEARFINAHLSVDWFATEYNNQNSPSTFHALSAEEGMVVSSVGVLGNMTLAGSGNATVDANTVDTSLDIDGNLVIGSGDTFLASSSANLTIGGDFSNSGTFTHNSGIVIFDSADTGETVTMNSSSFYNVIFNNAGGGWTLQDTLTVTSVLTITAGNFNGGAQTIHLTGSGTPFVVTGTFTAATSTISYENTTSATVTNTSYYNLEFNPASGTPTYTFAGGNSPAWYNASWASRKSIVLESDQVAGTADFTNFPVLINLSSDTDLAADAQDDGEDIVFTSSNGTTKLDHEIESFNGSTGALVAWVEIPTLDYNDDTTIFIYYGNGGAANQQNVDGTWASEFRGVWHLKEDPTSTCTGTKEVCDSTTNNNDGDANGSMTAGDSVAAKIGNGLDFDGSNDNIQITDATALEFSGTTSFTFSGWFKSNGSSDRMDLFGKNVDNLSDVYELGLTFGCTLGNAKDSGFNGPNSVGGDTCGLRDNNWHYIAFTYNRTGGAYNIYLDGSPDGNGTASSSSTIGSTGDLYLGSGDTNSNQFEDILDELRLTAAVRSADWIATEYSNQNTPSSFYALGSEVGYISTTTTVSNNFAIGGAGNATIDANTNDPTIEVNNNFTVGTSDTIQASSSSTLTIAGNFTNNGTFTANSGTVIFDDSGKTSILTYSAATSFASLTISTASKAMQFDNVDQTNITGTWTVNGSACGTKVTLYSDSSGNQWDVNATGTVSINYADIKDSNAIVSTTANNSTSGGNNSVNWTINNGACSSNTAPNAPTSLAQKKVTGGATLATGDWTNETQVQFTATATDPDASDTLYLCVEKDILGTGFSNTEDLCGSGVAYSGSGVAVTVTITGITDANEYHWQARLKDAANAYTATWTSYDVNAESARDFGVDTTAPTGGTVSDGLSSDVDFNSGSLSSLSANWASFNANVSGLLRYEYSIGTTQGGTQVVNWTNNSTTTSVTASSLTLNTSQPYYFNVRAVDNAGNTQSPVISSDGIFVSPELSFSVSPGSATFSNINASNSYTDTKTTTLTTSTNAYNGYIVRAFASDTLRETGGVRTIGMFNGGTYADPDVWGGGDTGFGYTSSDTTIQGSDIFNGATEYAPFSLVAPGDTVADHTALVTGTAITNESNTITYRVTASAGQSAGRYSTNIIYSATATY